MFTNVLRSLLFVGFGFLGTGIAYAEGGTCPPGFYPSNGPGVNACNPIPGYGQQQTPQAPPHLWERRWGAVATGVNKPVLGTVTDMTSRREAEQAAMANCAAKGGSPCKLQIAYDNQCAVMAVGDKGINVNSAVTMDQARKDAMQTCSVDGDRGCHVYYSACSLPVRIR